MSTLGKLENCNFWNELWNDENGFIISSELVLVSTILVIGLISGLVCLKTALVAEMKDVGNAIGSLDQSYSYSGFSKVDSGYELHAYTNGSYFVDVEDGDQSEETYFYFFSEGLFEGEENDVEVEKSQKKEIIREKVKEEKVVPEVIINPSVPSPILSPPGFIVPSNVVPNNILPGVIVPGTQIPLQGTPCETAVPQTSNGLPYQTIEGQAVDPNCPPVPSECCPGKCSQ